MHRVNGMRVLSGERAIDRAVGTSRVLEVHPGYMQVPGLLPAVSVSKGLYNGHVSTIKETAA